MRYPDKSSSVQLLAANLLTQTKRKYFKKKNMQSELRNLLLVSLGFGPRERFNFLIDEDLASLSLPRK